jgi:hypothetical protein
MPYFISLKNSLWRERGREEGEVEEEKYAALVKGIPLLTHGKCLCLPRRRCWAITMNLKAN